MNNIEESRLLTPREVGSLLGLDHTTLRNWRWLGKGPRFIKIGHLVRYKLSEVNIFINDQSKASTSDNNESCKIKD